MIGSAAPTRAMATTILSPGSAPPTSAEGWIGRVIGGRYRVLRALGEGAMGAVLVAEHLGLGKQVAIKMIRPELAADPELQERFEREALASARLAHPHIAGALDLGGLPGGGSYLVMPLCRGESLEAAIAAGRRLPWSEACAIAAQIADALAAAHAIGVVHRDLKPANVLVERGGGGAPRAVVLDFGVARIRDVAALGLPARDLTRRGAVIGTPGYMAPEQAMGDPADHRCDLYALGVILWECLAGRRLWSGETVTDLFTRQLGDEVPTLASAGVSDAPGGLGALIGRLCERRAERRPASAREVRDALMDMVRGTGSKVQADQRPRGRGWVIAAAATAAAVAGLAVALAAGGGASEGASGAGERVSEDVEAQLRSDEAGARKRAAAAILAQGQGEAPAYLTALARLEAAEVCAEKVAAARAVGEVGDPRALPGLQRAAARGPGLCGKALREAVAGAISALGGVGAEKRR